MTGKEALNLKVGDVLYGPESVNSANDTEHIITKIEYKKLDVIYDKNSDGSIDRYSYWTKSNDPHDQIYTIYLRAIRPDGTLGRETAYIRSHIEQYYKLDVPCY